MINAAKQKLHGDVAIAEEILSQTFQQPIRLEPGDTSGLHERPYVHRLKVSQRSSAVPETVILKQAAIRHDKDVYDPQASDGPASRLFNEWAGLQFLSEVCSDPLPAPYFYGGNRERGFIVMEDFGDGTRLDHALLGQDAALAEKTVVALFQTIGRMHAQTAGQAARYLEIRTALGPAPQWITNIGQIDEWDRQHMQVVLETFGVQPQSGFYDELETVWHTVRTPGPFTAYIHSDACPDNCHWVADDLRLLDFERGHYGHAFNDGIYAHIPFPSCWCANRLPEGVAQKAEAAYRAELVKGCPEADNDDLFYSTLVSVCIHRIFDILFRHGLVEGEPFDQDQKWGISTIGQRCLMWFGQVATLAERFGYFPKIGATARNMVEIFRARWPDVEDMPYYPAFR
jgi:hypothetical protein